MKGQKPDNGAPAEGDRQPAPSPGKRSRVEARYGRAGSSRQHGTSKEPFGSRLGPGASTSGQDVLDEIGERGGFDLSDVEMHTDSVAATKAAGMGARAFAEGQSIYFGSGEFEPQSDSGRELIAHEVAHTVQFRGQPAQSAAKREARSSEDDHSAESEADAFAGAFISGAQLPSLSNRPNGLARKPKKDKKAEGKAAFAQYLEKILGDKDFVLLGESAVISTKWFNEGKPTAVKGGVKAPSKVAVLLREWKNNGTFGWLEDGEIEQISQQIFVSDFDPAEPAFKTTMALSVFALLGPPPSSPVQWRIAGKGLHVVVSNQSLKDASTQIKPSGLRKTSRALTEVILAALERRTGMPIEAGLRARHLESGFRTKINDGTKAWVWSFGEAEIHSAFYEEPFWDEITKGAAADAIDDLKSTSGGTRFSTSLSEEDKNYFLRWIKELKLPDAGPTPGQLVSAATIMALRKIDAHPLRDKIIEKLKEGGGDGSAISHRGLTNIITAVETEVAAEAIGVDLGDSHRAEPPPVDRPVSGRIINQAGLIYPGLDCEFDFEVDGRPANMWTSPRITVRWYSHRLHTPKDHVDKEVCSYIESPSLPKDSFNTSFPHEGVFVIHAMVNHEWFHSNHFETKVEVKPKEERIREVEGGAFDGMGTDPYRLTHDFETSNFNEAYGDADTHIGKELKGHLPPDFERKTYKQRTQFIADRRKQLKELVEKYKGSSSRAERVREYAEEALERLDAAETRLGGLKKSGYTFFETRGSFLSDGNGVPDTKLHLMGAAKREDDGSVRVKIHDYTKLIDQRDKHFTGNGPHPKKAIEDAFLDLCKSYPPGTVSVLCELLDSDMEPTGRTYGFRLDSDTAWKGMKRTVWDPAVSIAVNVAGAVTMVFFPPSAVFVFPALALYNITEVVDEMVELDAEGNLTGAKMATSFAEIGLELLPYVGELKVVGKMGKSLVYTLDGLEIAGQGVLVTAQAMRDLSDLHATEITGIAKAHAELEQRRRDNPSDPELAKLQENLDKMIDAAREKSNKVIGGAVATGAISTAPTVIFNRIRAKQRLESPGSMHLDGVIIRREGVAPHYDPKTGHIVGDTKALDDAALDKLRKEYEADWDRKRGRLGAALGADGELVLVRHGVGGGVEVKNVKGGYEVTIPRETSFEDALGEIQATHKAAKAKSTEGVGSAKSKSGKSVENGPIDADLGVPVRTDDSLGEGARITYRLNEKGEVVIDELRVGPRASADTIAVHKKTIARMRRYNGTIGSLRSVWDEMRDALRRLMGKAPTKNPFPTGTRGWESFEELRKLDALITGRRSAWEESPTTTALDNDISFLEARRAHHQDVVRSIESGGIAYRKGVGFVAMPGRDKHTRAALAAGYPEPPNDFYFYRRLPEPLEDGRRYELHRDPLAPKDLELEDVQPEMQNGKPTGRLTPSVHSTRVKQPVAGLYESIDPSAIPEGWKLEDTVSQLSNGKVEIQTVITGPNGASGRMKRVYDPNTDTLTMKAAFFDDDLPRWVSTGTEMVPGKGTPTFAYVQMRQLRKLRVARSNLKKMEMNTIVNTRTILQLAAARKRNIPVDEAVLSTHSVQYAETAMTQSGHKIQRAKVTGGDEVEVQLVLEPETGGNADAIRAKNDALLAEHGLDRTDKALWGFDIEVELVKWEP